MKNKLVDVVFKKFQSYSFIIFLVLVLGAFFALAQLNNRNTDKPVNSDVPANNNTGNNNTVVDYENEVFKLPVASELNPQIARKFYDANASLEDQLSAIIVVDSTYVEHRGVNYTIDKEADFDVRASLSGKVTNVRQDSLLGYVVEVEHLYGVKTLYTSLSTIRVAVGDNIKQGDVLGKAGANNFDSASGVHVHFEVLLGGVNLNPNDLIGTKISEFDK